MGGEPGYFRLTDEKIKIVSKSKDVFYLLWGPYISNGSIHRTITSIVMFIFILLGDSQEFFDPFFSSPKNSERPSCSSRMAISWQPHVINTQPAALQTAKDLLYTCYASYLYCGDLVAIVSSTKITLKMTNFPIICMPITSSLTHCWSPFNTPYVCSLLI